MGDVDNQSERASTPGELDEILRVLTAKRRRYVLYYLREEEMATLNELARQLVAWEEQQAPEAVLDADIERHALELYHEHLPQLTETCLIEFGMRSQAARYEHPPALLETLLDVCRTRDPYPGDGD